MSNLYSSSCIDFLDDSTHLGKGLSLNSEINRPKEARGVLFTGNRGDTRVRDENK
jgi:hypothetical protein